MYSKTHSQTVCDRSHAKAYKNITCLLITQSQSHCQPVNYKYMISQMKAEYQKYCFHNRCTCPLTSMIFIHLCNVSSLFHLFVTDRDFFIARIIFPVDIDSKLIKQRVFFLCFKRKHVSERNFREYMNIMYVLAIRRVWQ